MSKVLFSKAEMVDAAHALPGRSERLRLHAKHFVNATPLQNENAEIYLPADHELAMFGLGCFWGAERKFWQAEGVYSTAVGYAAGFTPNPSYEEVCSGGTGHNEVVAVVYDPDRIGYEGLLKIFWENHNPTQGMRQGNDRGTQYRSGIYVYGEEQLTAAMQSKVAYQEALAAAGFDPITTEIIDAPAFYFAEEYHQQYLAKNPGGYCGLGGTGVSCTMS